MVLPKGKYITDIGKACLKLLPNWQRCSGQKPTVIKCVLNPNPNITKEEAKALKELRQIRDSYIHSR